MSEQINTINESIEKITNKDFGIYFFTLDTKGNPTAGVANIYEHVKILRDFYSSFSFCLHKLPFIHI